MIYEIPCSCGPKYIRQTKRALETFEGAPGSHKKRRDREISNQQSTPGLDTTSLSGRRHGSLTVQAIPPPC